MKEEFRSRLKELIDITGVSGHEEAIASYIYRELGQYADRIELDSIGNIYAVRQGSRQGKKLMLTAHMDQIGFMVKSILDNGFILFDKIGFPSDKVLVGRKVLVRGEIPGIIGIKSSHLESREEAGQVFPTREAYIDLGLASSKEVRDLGIQVGDPIGFYSDFMEMHNRDYICSKSLDNRINCNIVIELFKWLREENIDFSGELWAAITVQEETGMKGAFIAGNRIRPDYSIVLDTIPAGDTPDIDYHKDQPIRLGQGPVISLGDGLIDQGLAVFPNKNVVRLIEASAREAGQDLQRVISMSGYATDSSRLSLAGEGIPLATLAIPRRYSHSPVEMININDGLGSLEILKKLIVKQEGLRLDFI